MTNRPWSATQRARWMRMATGSIESTVTLRSLAPSKDRIAARFCLSQDSRRGVRPRHIDRRYRTGEEHSHRSPATISVTLDLGPHYAGYTAFVMATTWFNALDLFSDAYSHWVHEAINQYRDVPFDGTALDEFGYMKLPVTPSTVWRSHFAGRAFSARFQQATGMPLTQALFNTRYAPAGHPEVRIRAIDRYWDFLRKGPLGIEQEFYSLLASGLRRQKHLPASITPFTIT